MPHKSDKGSFHADIPDDAVAAALRSVERHAAAAAGEPAEVTVEVDQAEADPAQAEALASLTAQLELSQRLGRETQKRLEEAHERWVRASADLENYKKRAQRELGDVQKFGVEKLLKDLLPVLDNLDRALAAAAADDPLVAGVKLVRSSFEQALSRHGVKAFSGMGHPFDPSRHEALMQVPTAEVAPGTVVVEHARGFTLHDRLLRPALVGVATAPPAAPADGGGGAA